MANTSSAARLPFRLRSRDRRAPARQHPAQQQQQLLLTEGEQKRSKSFAPRASQAGPGRSQQRLCRQALFFLLGARLLLGCRASQQTDRGRFGADANSSKEERGESTVPAASYRGARVPHRSFPKLGPDLTAWLCSAATLQFFGLGLTRCA